MASVLDIMRMSPSERATHYKAENVDKVTINGNVFENYGAYSFLLEKTYKTEPQRTESGEIPDIDAYETMIVPHLKIDFSLLSIDDYRRLMQLIYSANEFDVECYDIVYDKMSTWKMYFAPDEMPKLAFIRDSINNTNDILFAVQDYTVEMIGTMNDDITPITLYIYTNWAVSNESVYEGSKVVSSFSLPYTTSFFMTPGEGYEFVYNGTLYTLERTGYRLKGWNTKADGTGLVNYPSNRTFQRGGLQPSGSLTSIYLYAQWEAVS